MVLSEEGELCMKLCGAASCVSHSGKTSEELALREITSPLRRPREGSWHLAASGCPAW